MRIVVRLCCVVIAFGSLVCCVRAADEPPYVAVWSDGTRTPSPTPLEWIAKEANPSLGQRSPLVGNNSLRRLRNITLPRPTYFGSRIELRGGDRLTGRVVEYLPEEADGLDRPACLVVEPLTAVDRPMPDVPVRMRVPVERLRRVVWEERTPRPLRPNTLFYRDGRQTVFRSLRWAPGGVRLLVEQGTEEIGWDDIAEVHLSEGDPWEEYAGRLAILSPDGAARLVRFDTTAGARVTTSTERLRVTGDVSKPESQLFVVQPAWSLDPLTIPQAIVAAQTIFQSSEAPLSDLEPSGYVHRAALAGGWKQWRADANVQGEPLVAVDRDYGWGFGVHAHSELQFDLPISARAFRTQLALDRAAGEGGCVKARIFFGSNFAAGSLPGRPLYESPAIVGSAVPLDSGRLELRPVAAKPNRLVLVCDALPYDRPAGSDPLDVRDVFDWLEPLVELDAAMLKSKVDEHAVASYTREHDARVAGSYGQAWRLVNHGYGNEWRSVVAVLQKPLVVSRTLAVPADAEALVVRAGAAGDKGGPTTLKITCGGTPLVEAPSVPTMADPRNPPVLRFALPTSLRGRELRCEFSFQPAGEGCKIDLRGATFIKAPAKK
ncbi:MAG: NPCBM/NEW2 domain-containing protein [Planctomycetia bacterium]|nr:NPCBM/NEW2 domain-containing protein [Planctomycetia bacterium]